MTTRTAIILAAGQGMRLRPLTDDTPKCLIPIHNQPILHRQLDALKRQGIGDVTIVVGHRKQRVIDYASSHFPNVRFTFVENTNFASTNTLYSLALTTSAIAPGTTVIQLNGDVVFDAEIVAALLRKNSEASYVALRLGRCGEEEVKAKLDGDLSVCALNKHMNPLEAAGEAVGINKFTGDFWETLKKNLQDMRDAFPAEYFELAVEKTIRDGMKLLAMDIGKHRAVEIDFPEDLENARRFFNTV